MNIRNRLAKHEEAQIRRETRTVIHRCYKDPAEPQSYTCGGMPITPEDVREMEKLYDVHMIHIVRVSSPPEEAQP